MLHFVIVIFMQIFTIYSSQSTDFLWKSKMFFKKFSYNIFCVHLRAHTHLNHTVPEDSLKTLIKELFCATLKLRCKDCKHKLMTWPIFRPILNASPCCLQEEAGWSWGCSRSALAACCSCSCYPAPFLSDATLTFQPLRWEARGVSEKKYFYFYIFAMFQPFHFKS